MSTVRALMDDEKVNLWMINVESGSAGAYRSLMLASKHDPAVQNVFSTALATFWFGIMYGGDANGVTVVGRYLVNILNGGVVDNLNSAIDLFANGTATGLLSPAGVAGVFQAGTDGRIQTTVPITDQTGGRLNILAGWMSDNGDRMILAGTWTDSGNTVYAVNMVLGNYAGTIFTQTNIDGTYDLFGLRGSVAGGAPVTIVGGGAVLGPDGTGLSNFQTGSNLAFYTTGGLTAVNIHPDSKLQATAAGNLLNLNAIADPPGGAPPNQGTTVNIDAIDGDIWEQNRNGGQPDFDTWSLAGVDTAFGNNHVLISLRQQTAAFSQADLDGNWRFVGIHVSSNYRTLAGEFFLNGSLGTVSSGYRDERDTAGNLTARVMVTGLTNAWGLVVGNSFRGRLEMN